MEKSIRGSGTSTTSEAPGPDASVAPEQDGAAPADKLSGKQGKFVSKGLRDSMRENVPEQYQEAYDRIILAGMKVMFSEETHDMFVQAAGGEGPMDDKIAQGIGGLMLGLYDQSNKTMPLFLIIPAGIDLTMQAVEFAGEANLGDVDMDTMANAIQKYTILVFEKFGVSQEQMMAGPPQEGAEQPGAEQAQPQPQEAAPPTGAGLINQGV